MPYTPSSPMAYVTLVTSDSYAVGSAVLAASLKAVKSLYPLYALVTPALYSRRLLLASLDGLIDVESIHSTDLDRLQAMGRPDLVQALTKLHAWNLDGSQKIKVTFNPHSRFHRFHEAIIRSGSVPNDFHASSPKDGASPTASQVSSEEALMTHLTSTPITCMIPLKFQKVVFVDADMYFIQNVDDLFNSPKGEENVDQFAACPDIGWPDTFNSGLMVITPNSLLFKELLNLALQSSTSFDGADQGLLNQFFEQWAVSGHDYSIKTAMPGSPKEIHIRRLPFIYNVAFSVVYSFAPASLHHRKNIKGIHFLGANNKPWTARRMHPTSYGSYTASSSSFCNRCAAQGIWLTPNGIVPEEVASYFQAWWQLYDSSRVRWYVEALGGLSHFGIFGGNCPSGDPSKPGEHGCHGLSEPFSQLELSEREAKNAQWQNFPGGNRANDDGWGQHSLSSSSQSHSGGGGQDQADNFSSYRIRWSPQLEQQFNNQNGSDNQNKPANYLRMPNRSSGGGGGNSSLIPEDERENPIAWKKK